MNTRHLLLGIASATILSGCAREIPPAPLRSSPHAEVDAAISTVRLSQQSAAAQVSAISRSVTDPATRRAIGELQQTINEIGLKLETATGKIAWYEGQYDLVISQRDWWQAQDGRDKAARVQAEKERDALIWIFSLACGMTALSTFRPALQVVQMPWQLVALGGVFSGGFALGFTLGRYGLRFLALFTPHLPF